MTKINQKLRWLLMVLPLAGCTTSIPLTSAQNADAVLHQAPVVTKVSNPQNTAVSELRTEKVELPTASNSPSSPSINPLGQPGNPQALANPKAVNTRPVTVDPNVKLISPPTGLPQTNYVVPEVAEKENYVPPAHITKCTKGKHGKKICKTLVKSDSEHAVKGKKGSHASEKSSGKHAQKTTTAKSSEKNHKSTSKKDAKHKAHKN
jgi:hypothetical protein